MFVDLDVELGHRFQFFSSTLDPFTNEPVFDEPAGDGYFTLRSMQPFFESQNGKRKKVAEIVFNPKIRAMERITYLPELSEEESRDQMEAAWDWAIVDFEGFKDKATKQVIPVTRENKVKMTKNPVIQRFLSKCFKTIDEESVVAEEKQAKNSSALPSGLPVSGDKAAKSAK